ncbi:MAG TPA: amino acid ABC transporter permease, partial [Beijerinckiaceae bacterium]|nr:amino acid ABC transporter permease [Beijerinckiaceae bacterium]
MNYDLNFNLIWRHSGRLVDGLILSLQIAGLSIALAMTIGVVLALAYVDGNRFVRAAVAGYVEFIRNVPLLLLVYLVFYGLPTVVDIRYDATTSFVATLSIYGGAYLVEVMRAGLQAVPQGLIEAGKAIGLTPLQRLVYVRLPTAFRIALPSLSNTYVSLFKDTSIASVLAVPELT